MWIIFLSNSAPLPARKKWVCRGNKNVSQCLSCFRDKIWEADELQNIYPRYEEIFRYYAPLSIYFLRLLIPFMK